MKYFMAVAVSAAASSMSCAASAATVTVSTAAQFDAAIRAAVGGDIIKVAAGNYGDVAIRNINFATPVTIVAANSAQRPVFTHLSITGSSGMNFSRLVVSSPAPATGTVISATDIWRSHDIRVSDMTFRGVTGGGVSNEARGLRLSDSVNVTVAGNSFTELSNGITTDGASRLTITDNAFSGIRVNGIISDGATNSVILRNRFSQFRPEAGDHPDAIQIFTSGNATNSLKVTDNLILGDADGQMQGVFISNNIGDRALLDRITVTNNLMWGAMWNGIAAFDANRVTLSDNLLYSNLALAVPKTYLRLENVAAAVVSGNYAGAYLYADLGILSGAGNILSTSDAAALLAVTTWDLTHAASAKRIPYADRSTAGMDDEDDYFAGRFASALPSAGAVPEPARWLSMIAGFMVIGVASRRLQPTRGRRIQPA